MDKILMQGDLALRPIAALPEGATKKSENILAYGEHSGHAHVVQQGEVFEYEGRMYVAVGGDGASLDHMNIITGGTGDHNSLVLTPGVYEVLLQNEYNPFAQVFERVMD